jgi:hypothetical protein
MDQSWNASAKRYPGGKVLVASLPGVEIGSTIEVEYEIAMHDMPYLSGFETFQFQDALDEKDFKLTAPADLPVHVLVSGAKGIISEKAQTTGGVQTLEWAAHNVKALPTEQQLPPAWNYLAGVDFYIGNPADYWKSLNEAMVARSQKSAKAAALAQQLAGPAKGKIGAITAIRDYVAQNIREAGPSFTTLTLSELSDADTTLADGYGHSADRAILIHAMLSAAGFHPEFVIASGLPPVAGIKNIVKSFPLPGSFQAPLVRVSADGEDYYLNDTDQYSHLGTTAFDGKLGMALASGKMETIQAAENCDNKTETDYALSLAVDGKARIQISTHFYGGNYNAWNHFFAELPPEERKHYYQEAVSGVAQGARAEGDLTTDFSTYPGLEQFTVDLDDYGVVAGKYLYFNLPFTPSQFAAVTDQRTLPFFIADKSESIIRTEVELPAGYRGTDVSPRSERLAAPGGSESRITATGKNNQCVVTYDFENKPAVISPQDYPALLNIQSALGRRLGTIFLLERE